MGRWDCKDQSRRVHTKRFGLASFTSVPPVKASAADVNFKTGQSPAHFSSLLTTLFESLALIISQHQPVVEKYYGNGKMLTVATKLLSDADVLGIRVVSAWEEERRVKRKLNDAKKKVFGAITKADTSPMIGGGSQAASIAPSLADDGLDPREIDALLAELAMMGGRWQLLRRFLYDRLKVSCLLLSFPWTLFD